MSHGWIEHAAVPLVQLGGNFSDRVKLRESNSDSLTPTISATHMHVYDENPVDRILTPDPL